MSESISFSGLFFKKANIHIILAQRAENLSRKLAGQEKWLALAFLTSIERNWKNEASLKYCEIQHGPFFN